MSYTILITGATSGLGEALTKLIISNTPHTAIAIGRNKKKLNELKSISGKKLINLTCDLSNQDEVSQISANIKDICAQSSNTLYLAHCAGIAAPSSFIKISKSSLTKTFETNLFGPIRLTQELLPIMKNSRIIFISSGLAHFTLPDLGSYSMSKAALNSLSRTINTEISPYQAISTIITPGIFDSSMQKSLRETDQFNSRETFNKFKTDKLLRSASEVADFVKRVFLDTSDNEFKNKCWDIDS
ncbi:3-oxoacyl-[acyl-carrier-protein] reductase FabG1 (plasmid) [Piscirickettsia salmonis]|uniref:SDR family NAD(P)-dependent oxidoreductase n=1 Tax=Piscirickettsia salmonis TaxID=1238 RepID=UPI0012B6B180|nr:SDR family NAD(P)-dependent oxidoreductase [Piscirickettsia salmonis]QGP52547.1 3-oxoacyl-[acyl-carrier-protein] reductase FabG1 [Piscirickettsia salmonis]